tara:strand:+ start:126 stop:293 length:168 start_codon:yes stop_codon:yes gene_type:complete
MVSISELVVVVGIILTGIMVMDIKLLRYEAHRHLMFYAMGIYSATIQIGTAGQHT